MTRVRAARDQPALQGTYSDGHPLDDVHYLECKIILKADRFTSVQSFHEFGALVGRTAAQSSVGFSTLRVIGKRPRIREVVFLDTADFKLYNNAFILRRRIPYEDGFPIGEPEIVFKYRHPDLQKAAEMDVRPNIRGTYRVKFKAEALPLRDKIGGFRRLFSHNVEFGWSELPKADRMSTRTLGRIFPALRIVKRAASDRVELVNQTIVEEVLQDLGELDFGKGVRAMGNVALWRQRGDHMPLVGEFAFQCKFKRRSGFHDEAMNRCERFFKALQLSAKESVLVGSTKTGIVYRLRGNPPQAYE
jgi:hypothetical protein